MNVNDPRTLAREVERALHGRELLLATDFDGTLSSIVPFPDDARLVPGAREALSALVPRARVLIVSGRALDDLATRVPVPGIALAGEHGGELLLPDGTRRSVPVPAEAAKRLADFGRYAHVLLDGVGGEVEVKRLSVAAHTRRIPKTGQPLLEAALVHEARRLEDGHVEVVAGKRVVELRVRGAEKGHGLREMRAAIAPGAHVVALGDDVTDEDLFGEALRSGGLAIKVGAGETLATRRLEGPFEVVHFLAALAEARSIADAA